MDTSPTNEILNLKAEKKSRFFAILGLVLFSGPIWGSVGAVIGMIGAFAKLSEGNSEDPDIIASNISIAMTSAMIGIIVGLVGVVFILVAYFGFKNREMWFGWWVVRLSVISSLFLFPHGLIVTVPITILFIVKWKEFKHAPKVNIDPSGD